MSCGTDRELIRLMVGDAIKNLIADGTVQGGLRDCNGDILKANAKVMECTASANDDTNKPKLSPTDLDVLADGTLKLTLSDGSSLKTPLTTIASKPTTLDVKDNELKLAFADGTSLSAGLCGWRGAQPCRYYATLNLRAERDECDVGLSRVLYAFHADDLRDPAADVKLVDCNDNTIGYLYSKRGGTHTVPYTIKDKYGNDHVVGYALVSPIVEVWADSCCSNNQGDLLDEPKEEISQPEIVIPTAPPTSETTTPSETTMQPETESGESETEHPIEIDEPRSVHTLADVPEGAEPIITPDGRVVGYTITDPEGGILDEVHWG